MSNFKDHLSKYLDKMMGQIGFESAEVVLCSQEGLSLFCSSKKDVSSICALTAGVWQASLAISQINSPISMDEFRVSCDSSSSGIYMLGVNLYKKNHILLMVYDELVNPGKFKHKLRALKEALENDHRFAEENVSKEQDDFLFDNITDEEMDNLFGLTGR